LAPQPALPAGVSIDAAISGVAADFGSRLPDGARIAVLDFDALTVAAGEYIMQGLWEDLENNTEKHFVMVDRRNLDKIRGEARYAVESGEVSDDSAVELGHELGAQVLVSGALTALGNEYHLAAYMTNVEAATSAVKTETVAGNGVAAALLTKSVAETVEAEKRAALAPYRRGAQDFALTVQAGNESGVYHDGDYMSFQVSAAADCYIKVTYLSVDGTAQVIYPLSPLDNNHLLAGQVKTLPDNTRYRLTAPFGREYILIAAYKAPFAVNGNDKAEKATAETFATVGKYDLEIADSTQAIALNPNNADAYNNRAAAYVNTGKYDLSIPDSTRAIKLNPNLANAYYNRGIAYRHLGEYDSAIADYSKAIALNPNYADAYYNRGSAFYGEKQYRKARADFEKYLQMVPTDPDGKTMLDKLAKMGH
jgi:tetratricopeptide (TPR) repeat protein